MPDAAAPRQVHVLVGGTGAVRFGVDLDQVGRVLEHDELPDGYRSVNVPRLLDAEESDPERDRYAEVPTAGADAHLRLGPTTTVTPVSADRLEPVPRILDRTAARWGWQGLWHAGAHVVVLLDAARLSTLGAPATRGSVR